MKLIKFAENKFKKSKDRDGTYGLFIVVSVVFGLTALLLQFRAKKENPTLMQASENVSERVKADTFIPEGFTLIPIEVANYKSLDSILGNFGVVDLFSTPLDPTKKARRIAYSVKILRAPRNPNHFAVLLPESRADQVAGHPGPFTVTVRNPKEVGIRFVKKKKQIRRIHYDGS